MSAEKIPIYRILSDEEFEEIREKNRKKQLLDDIREATKTPFSVKNIQKPKKKTDKEEINYSTDESRPKLVSVDSSNNLKLSDDEWDRIMEKASVFTDLRTPIDRVTDSEMLKFSLDDIQPGEDDDNEYQKMFKREQAMYAEILKDVSNQAKIANDMVKNMSKSKPGYGASSKVFPDLLSAANSLNTTRASIVDKMAGLKKITAELDLKKRKELGIGKDGAENNLENTADMFFKNILGNRKGFIDASLNGVPPMVPNAEYGNENQLSPEEDYHGNQQQPDQGYRRNRASYITAPLYDNNDRNDYDDDNYDDVDAYGYIRNENRNISVCVQVFNDGRLEFVAVDEDGQGVDDYELPSEELLATLNIRPTSNYATDDDGRRYRIIHAGENADLSDL